MITRFHADDYGITTEQARAILALSNSCGGIGALTSVSIFANSPAFEQSAALAAPFVENGSLLMGLHVNLVEGCPCANPNKVPLLIGEGGTFCNDFTQLLKQSYGSQRAELRRQIEEECTAQIERYLTVFPYQQTTLRLDSHQHTHAIPLVFDALLAAARACGCRLEYVRTPAEPLAPHLLSRQTRKYLSLTNLAKKLLLGALYRCNRGKLPEGCTTSLFCGVLLSGTMAVVDGVLTGAFEAAARTQTSTRKNKMDGNVEMLFHPISVNRNQCLDPANEPFAAACASPERNNEAHTLATLQPNVNR